MAKKVILGPKPQPQQNPVANADEWVNGSQGHGDTASGASAPAASAPAASENGTAPEAPAMKRLTIDVTESLHAQIKSRCALRGVKMADEIRALLERHFLTQEGT